MKTSSGACEDQTEIVSTVRLLSEAVSDEDDEDEGGHGDVTDGDGDQGPGGHRPQCPGGREEGGQCSKWKR